MPKKIIKKSKKDRQKYLILTVLVLLVITALVIVPFVKQKILEHKFNTLQSDIINLQNDLTKQLPNTNFVKNNYCYRENFKFEEGPLKCRIEIKTPNPISLQEALKIKETINNNYNWVEITSADPHKIPDVSSNTYKEKDFSCSSVYTSFSDKDKTKGIDFEFHCAAFSDRLFYPYREN